MRPSLRALRATLPPAAQWPVIFGLVLCALAFFNSPGTSDVGIWQRWAEEADRAGIIRGFRRLQADYPPITLTVLHSCARLGRYLGDATILTSIKASVLVGLLATTWTHWIITRQAAATVALHLSLLLNSVALVYTDIYVAPLLLVALWALRGGLPVIAGIAFALACMTKWQPLIVAPFVALHVLGPTSRTALRNRATLTRVARVGLPALAVVLVVGKIFGFAHLLAAFRAASSHQFLSGNALNLAWVVTHFLHVHSADVYGPLVNGEAAYIVTDDRTIRGIHQLLFAVAYVGILWLYLRREKTFENLLRFSLVGYMAYFMFNVGVHENHLFLPTIIAVVWFAHAPERSREALVVSTMSNLNLFLFYGSTGTLPYSRVVAGVDIALVVACCNVALWLWLALRACSADSAARDPVAAALHGTP